MTIRAPSPIPRGSRRSCRRRSPTAPRSRWPRGWRRRSYCSRARIGAGWHRHGRTTVGLSGLSIGDCGRYVADWLRGKAPPSPRDGFSAPLILRFAVDDLKAYCLEAAAAGTAKPSSRQLGDWFWNETATGAAIHALREMLLAQRGRAAEGRSSAISWCRPRGCATG